MKGKKYVSVVVAAGLVTAVAAAPAVAGTVGPRGRADLQAMLDRIVDAGAVGAIAEVRDGSRTWRGTSGRARIGKAQAAPVDGRFRVGSVTKSFTATVVLQLVSEGRLELSDSVEQWLPGLVDKGADTTIRHLLQHTSGLPEYTTDMFDEAGIPKERFRSWTGEELVDRVRRLPREFPPGDKYSYSNTNYIVLGLLIERVTGRPYATEVRERILRPLGMVHTRVPGASPEVPGPHAHAYVPVRKGGKVVPVDVTRFNPTIAGAAGEIISTTEDLNRFYRALFQGRLLPAALVKEMQDPGMTKKAYGLGLEPAPLPCGTAWGHGGGAQGYLTVAFSSADGSRQVALSMTSYSGDPEKAAVALLTSALCP
ncbi:serine hydrolase domain-containing protein [Nonomuraea angiospora]|uniref:serine hydrolase domain-containing protein n=1 Tax=Nonomuraea angiospora TaxID=46172 RepID=UPI0029A7F957|nr:serine hydrolase domain-containing protein [Nonomuraea angiospora]MDX3104265.1 serine hydrolase [Nonomuraea angiospora]